MIGWIGEAGMTALVGFFGGMLLGLAARMGRFCTLGAIEDALYSGSWIRARMWGVALGGAIAMTFTAGAVGLVDLPGTFNLASSWSPVAVVTGGLLFGYGMALAGNCGFGAVARAGGGDLRSLVVVLVMGLSAYAVLSGPFAALRVAIFPPSVPSQPQGLAHGIAAMTGIPVAVPGIAAGLGILGLSLSDSAFLKNWRGIAWGLCVAVAIVSGWIGMGWIAATGFAAVPVVSHSFAAPLGGSILWLMTASGTELDFGIGSVTGVLAGAFLGCLIRGHFRWEACEDPRELRRQLLGAVVMGIGAVLAVGCSVGQGLTAFSVLAYSAPLASAAVVLGAGIGLRQLITGFRVS